MNGGTKKKMKKLVCAGIVTLALAGCAKATLLNSNAIVQDGIEYYIQTNKSVYDLGEDVEFLYQISNFTDEEWEVRWLGTGVDIVVEAKEEDFIEVWSWSWYKGGDAGPRVLRLQADESVEFPDIWPQVDYRRTWEIEDDMAVTPGTYTVTGSFRPTAVSVAVDITIIPEPATIVLLCGGIGLLRFKRSRP